MRSKKKATDVIMVNAVSLDLNIYEFILMDFFIYSVVWREKERIRIRGEYLVN